VAEMKKARVGVEEREQVKITLSLSTMMIKTILFVLMMQETRLVDQS
jgi:hypothetical protein